MDHAFQSSTVISAAVCPLPRRQFLGRSIGGLLLSSWLTGSLLAAPGQGLAALSDRERTFQEFITTHMTDADGLCYSALCAATLKPWTNAQLAKLAPDDQRMLTDWFQNSPDKAGCLSYENALMATGEFALSQMARYRVTGEDAARQRAHRAIKAILAVIDEGRSYMPGWLPKPFGGIRNARNSHEMSTDQYTKVILALYTWRSLADTAEQAVIDRFIVDAADFFIARKFRHAYRHRTIVTAMTHQHALGLFVPLVVLAAKTSGDAAYRTHLAQFSGALDAAMTNPELANFNMTSLLIEGLNLAIGAGCDDPRLPKLIGILWQRGVAHIAPDGDGIEDGKPPRKTSEATRLAAASTLVEALDPATRTTDLAIKILGRQSDVRQMTHTRMRSSICEIAVTSWLLAYWRLRKRAAG